ncbi:hypothetical protein RND71_039880 [Anisodus tanguticus]|uniref:Uncharacterized protein n=1 Tax=Anisodus tanguticus TaxID=243964 RepID=A0AAE1UY00_9SOLA|nr:hypothetical protein RND71_039880 [Anisodus tanguticus]
MVGLGVARPVTQWGQPRYPYAALSPRVVKNLQELINKSINRAYKAVTLTSDSTIRDDASGRCPEKHLLEFSWKKPNAILDMPLVSGLLTTQVANCLISIHFRKLSSFWPI